MTDGFTSGFCSGAIVFTLFMFVVCLITHSYEREQWCEHLHESHKAVEQCKVTPDWKETRNE